MRESRVRVKSQASEPPTAGTEPEPVQPTHAVRQPLVPSGG
jgi:hypothetical protein